MGKLASTQQPRPSAWSAGQVATRIVVKARDLDTDHAAFITIDALAPIEPNRQRTQLIEAVTTVHPEAELRSFADAVASFVDSDHLIVAYYEDRLPKRLPRTVEGRQSPETLF